MERRVLIRAARQSDLSALTDIYNYYVQHTIITFDVDVFEPQERQGWFDQFSESGPHRLFVAEREGAVVGYAGSTKFRAKPAYAESVETTIYLSPDVFGEGIGGLLYGELLTTLEGENVHRAYGVLGLPNDASRALHIKFGFKPLHVLSEVGFKFGRYVDTEWFEKKF
ncbi:MAG: N-acetyltransferase family protein [Pseudomonadota bacterium]